MAKKKTEGVGYKVVAPFRDKSDWNIYYEVGQDVSELSQDRLDELVEKGLVEQQTAQ
ncbi:MAG: hypothetical protein ABIN91_11225 [Mucilaginibacter sp.]|uniref:hypothetical protein n=1 Tax=Mucilaginibacter sp. TaxID=1882438 RepID=UPI003263C015